MMVPNRQRKYKKIHWLQDVVKSIIYDTIPPSTPGEQLPFPQNRYFVPEDCANTPPLTCPTNSELPNRFYTLQPPGISQYSLSVSDPVYKTHIAPHDNYPLPGQLQMNDLSTRDLGQHRARQEAASRYQEIIPLHLHPDSVNAQHLPSLLSRRFVVHGALSILFIFVATATFISMVPLGYHKDLAAHTLFSFHTLSVRKNDTVLIEGQSATATAVTVDGYDPGGGLTYAGVLAIPEAVHIAAADYGSLTHFFYGQCTYWANMRYHQATGHWIPWLGNAYQWAYQAPAYGWTLSTTPNPRGTSIMVFSPYAEGAGAYGHVAVVESVNSDGSVTTSNWNWGGAWATLSYRTFYPGPGVSFIWYPG